MSEQNTLLRLTRAQALVLFEWLARVSESGTLQYEDPAEQDVLWELEAQLERTLTEPLASNYSELLDAARREVKRGAG